MPFTPSEPEAESSDVEDAPTAPDEATAEPEFVDDELLAEAEPTEEFSEELIVF